MRSEYVTICITPLLCSGGGKKFRPPPEEGASRLPNTGSASAYPCTGDIIARFVEFGKVRNCLPPPRGKVPPQGADEGNAEEFAVFPSKVPGCRYPSPHPSRLRRATFPQGKAKKKSPGGGLGIDFFPYHVILKIKRGAAGRREPPHVGYEK